MCDGLLYSRRNGVSMRYMSLRYLPHMVPRLVLHCDIISAKHEPRRSQALWNSNDMLWASEALFRCAAPSEIHWPILSNDGQHDYVKIIPSVHSSQILGVSMKLGHKLEAYLGLSSCQILLWIDDLGEFLRDYSWIISLVGPVFSSLPMKRFADTLALPKQGAFPQR